MITVNLVDCWLVVELALGKYGASCDIMWEMAVHNEVAKVMFLHVTVCSQGQYLGRYHSPGPRYTSPDQVHPPGTRYTPWTKYTPWEQVHTPGTRYTPGPGAHPPEPGTTPGPDTPLQTRYSPPRDQVGPGATPLGPGTSPGPGTVPPGPGTPPPQAPGTPPDHVHPLDQVHPPGPGNAPDQVHPPRRWLMLRMVRILLDCILVNVNKCSIYIIFQQIDNTFLKKRFCNRIHNLSNIHIYKEIECC